MKLIKFKKYSKKIKVFLKKTGISVQGPLGIVEYNFNKTNIVLVDNSFFLNKKELNFFIKKIKFLFTSVTKGWFIELILNGIGFKCFRDKEGITFDLGYSTLINYFPSSKLKIKILKNKIILFSIDRNYLNNVARLLKKFAVSDPYKGKGILLKDEKIKLKKKK